MIRLTAVLAMLMSMGCYRSHTIADAEGGTHDVSVDAGPLACHVLCAAPELVAERILPIESSDESLDALLGLSRVGDTLAVLTNSSGFDGYRDYGATGIILVNLRTGTMMPADTADIFRDDDQLVGGSTWSEGDEIRALLVTSAIRDIHAPAIARTVYARWDATGVLLGATALPDFSGALTTHSASSLGQPAAAFARGSRGVGAVIRGASVESATLTLGASASIDAMGPLVTLAPGPDEASPLSGVVLAGDAVAVVGGGYFDGVAARPAFVAVGPVDAGPLLPTMLPGTDDDPAPLVTAVPDGFVVHRFVTDATSSLEDALVRLTYTLDGTALAAQRIATPGGFAPLAMAVSGDPTPVLAWTAREPTSLTAADVFVLPDVNVSTCDAVRVDAAIHLPHLPSGVFDERSLAVRTDGDGTWVVVLSAEPGVMVDFIGMKLSVYRVPSCTVTP